MRIEFSSLNRCIANVLILCLFSLCLLRADDAVGQSSKIAIIPLANYSSSQKALSSITDKLSRGLNRLGISIIDREAQRQVMREARLRLTGEIDSVNAAYLSDKLGARLYLTGSIDLFLEQENPEVGLSLRIYDSETSKLLWIANEYETGEDAAGILGIGRTTDIEIVAQRVVDKILKKMTKNRLESNASDDKARSGPKVAVVRFDNSSDFTNAEFVATNVLMEELWNKGYDILEPGELSRLRIQMALDLDGGITDSALSALRVRFGIRSVLTGTVSRFEPARNIQTDSPPSIEMTVRTIAPENGTVLNSVAFESDGAESETLFGVGRTYSIGATTRHAIHRHMKAILREMTQLHAESTSSIGD